MKTTKINWTIIGTLIYIFVWILTAILEEINFPFDTTYKGNYNIIEIRWGMLHYVTMTLLIVLNILTYFIFLLNVWQDSDEFFMKKYIIDDCYENEKINKTKIIRNKTKIIRNKIKLKKMGKKIIWLSISAIILFNIYNVCKIQYHNIFDFYNSTIEYKFNYTQKSQERISYYDMMYKTYIQMNTNTNLNKMVFTEITKIIFDSRKDSKQLMWKWVKENQEIDYNEFSKFYSQLNNFIINKRDGYFQLERECQIIVNSNNKLLETFPNNIYNKFLSIEPLIYEVGFLSENTNTIFKIKIENITE